MRMVRKEDLVPGMIMGEDIYNFGSQVVIPKGSVLTDRTIAKLEYYAVIKVRIEDKVPDSEPEPEKEETSECFSHRVKKTSEFKAVQERYRKEVQKLEETTEEILAYEEEVGKFRVTVNEIVEKGSPVDEEKLYGMADSILQSGKSALSVLGMLHHLHDYDDSTFEHAINVALISNMLAGWCGYSEEKVKKVTVCGMLHDIGKLKMPSHIIKKPGRLTDEEFLTIKKHPVEGYEILSKCSVDEHIRNAALMHHEKCDGSGYPSHLKGNEIDPYAKLIAIADVYDAMTSARVYRGPMCPFKVIAIFEEEGFQKYDVGYIMTFLGHVADYYINEPVRLSDGREGEIIFINRQHLSRPLVKCGETIVDLWKQAGVRIEEIL